MILTYRWRFDLFISTRCLVWMSNLLATFHTLQEGKINNKLLCNWWMKTNDEMKEKSPFYNRVFFLLLLSTSVERTICTSQSSGSSLKLCWTTLWSWAPPNHQSGLFVFLLLTLSWSWLTQWRWSMSQDLDPKIKQNKQTKIKLLNIKNVFESEKWK